MLELNKCQRLFKRALPKERQGEEHASLKSFHEATNFTPRKQKELSLVVVSAEGRILLGLKHRGFGQGMFSSFGGKVDPEECSDAVASRKLEEDTGIQVSVETLTGSKVGILYFTFEDDTTEMAVHLYRVNVSCGDSSSSWNSDNNSHVVSVDPSCIRGCDEITPQWVAPLHGIPFENMYVDYSIWLPYLLLSNKDRNTTFDGWFHFLAGGQATNTILHHFVQQTSKPTQQAIRPPTLTLERRLFHALHDKKIISPSLKEFNEAWAFVNTVRTVIPRHDLDVVIDVAGGHGALAALFLTTTSAQKAIVVDPADVGRDSVRKAWQRDFFPDAELRYRYECLRLGLPLELDLALQSTSPDRILVVACHACQHLSDETVAICCTYGVHVCVMPCCQRDSSKGMSWKNASKNIQVPIEKTMDILLAGKVMAWSTGQKACVRYDVRMKTIDKRITPQNRIIICRALPSESGTVDLQKAKSEAHKRLEMAYKRAHPKDHSRELLLSTGSNWELPFQYLIGGIVIGVVSCRLWLNCTR